MDPLSIAAGVVGIVAPTLHCVRLLANDIQKIIEAPSAVKSLNDDLRTIGTALTSLQSVSDQQWASLGETVIKQSESTITLCKDSCDKFKDDLGRWTRHSNNGNLSWRDPATVGVFKHGNMRSISEQLQNGRTVLTLVVTIATLHSSLQQTDVVQGVMEMISTKETEIKDAIAATDKQLAKVNAKLGTLCLAKRDPDETAEDQASAISQVAVEQKALGESRKLLEDLLMGIQVAASNFRNGQAQVVNTFGNLGQGMMFGVNHGAISGVTFGSKE